VKQQEREIIEGDTKGRCLKKKGKKKKGGEKGKEVKTKE